MLSHLLGFKFGVEDGQLSKHAHVGPLQAESRLQHGDQLFKVTTVLKDGDGAKITSYTMKTFDTQQKICPYCRHQINEMSPEALIFGFSKDDYRLCLELVLKSVSH